MCLPVAPASSNASACTRPSPLAPPDTTTTLSFKLNSGRPTTPALNGVLWKALVVFEARICRAANPLGLDKDKKPVRVGIAAAGRARASRAVAAMVMMVEGAVSTIQRRHDARASTSTKPVRESSFGPSKVFRLGRRTVEIVDDASSNTKELQGGPGRSRAKDAVRHEKSTSSFVLFRARE